MNKVLKFYDYDRALVFYEEAFLHIHQAPVKRSGFKIVAKPILLLTILKAIDDGFITINRFSYDQMESRYTALFKNYFMQARQETLPSAEKLPIVTTISAVTNIGFGLAIFAPRTPPRGPAWPSAACRIPSSRRNRRHR